MTITNTNPNPNPSKVGSDFYRYADHVKAQKQGCMKEDRCCYSFSLKGRAELWDNQREAYYEGNYKACTGWSLAQRGAWVVSCLMEAPTLFCVAGTGLVSSLGCLGCAVYSSVSCCTRSVILCCDEDSKKLAALVLSNLLFSGACCCLSTCSCVLCVEVTAVCLPTTVVPECTMSMDVTGCLEKQQRVIDGITEKIEQRLAKRSESGFEMTY